MISLKDYKNKKQMDLIAKDLMSLSRQMDRCMGLLISFKKYIPAKEIITLITNNKTLIETHLNKYKRLKDEEKKES